MHEQLLSLLAHRQGVMKQALCVDVTDLEDGSLDGGCFLHHLSNLIGFARDASEDGGVGRQEHAQNTHSEAPDIGGLFREKRTLGSTL